MIDEPDADTLPRWGGTRPANKRPASDRLNHKKRRVIGKAL